MSEPTYTLAEARRELAKRECLDHGHDWSIQQTIRTGPLRIVCERCGWSGTVTMDEWP